MIRWFGQVQTPS